MANSSNVEQLIEDLTNPDAHTRLDAVKALSYSNDLRAVEPLIQTLVDSEWIIRSSVIAGLWRLNDVRAVPHIIARLGDEDEDVRDAAINALASFSNSDTVSFLHEALHADEPFIREGAARVLEEIRDDTALPFLIAALADPVVEVKNAAIRALGNLRDPRAETALLPILEEQRTRKVGSTIGALAFAFGLLQSRKAVEPLLTLLEERIGLSPWFIANALGQIGDARALPLLHIMKNTDTGSFNYLENSKYREVSNAEAAANAIALIEENERTRKEDG